MTDLIVLPTVTLQVTVSPKIPLGVLSRVVRGYGSIVVRQGYRVVVPADEDAGQWIVTTLDMLGYPASMR